MSRGGLPLHPTCSFPHLDLQKQHSPTYLFNRFPYHLFSFSSRVLRFFHQLPNTTSFPTSSPPFPYRPTFLFLLTLRISLSCSLNRFLYLLSFSSSIFSFVYFSSNFPAHYLRSCLLPFFSMPFHLSLPLKNMNLLISL